MDAEASREGTLIQPTYQAPGHGVSPRDYVSVVQPVAEAVWRLWPRLVRHVRPTARHGDLGPLASPVFLLDEILEPLEGLESWVAWLGQRRPALLSVRTGMWLDAPALRAAASDPVLGVMRAEATETGVRALRRIRDMPRLDPRVWQPDPRDPPLDEVDVVLVGLDAALHELKDAGETARNALD